MLSKLVLPFRFRFTFTYDPSRPSVMWCTRPSNVSGFNSVEVNVEDRPQVVIHQTLYKLRVELVFLIKCFASLSVRLRVREWAWVINRQLITRTYLPPWLRSPVTSRCSSGDQTLCQDAGAQQYRRRCRPRLHVPHLGSMLLKYECTQLSDSIHSFLFFVR